HACDLIRVEVVLLGPAGLEGHLAERCDAHAHGGGPLHLGAHTIRIDGRTAVHRDVHARDRHDTLIVDRHLHDRRDVAHEAVVRGNAEAAALWKGPAPPRLARGRLHHTTQPARVDRISLGGLAVIP